MKYIDEYRDPAIARAIADRIRNRVTKPWVLMEVCGGQTHTLLRYGIGDLLGAGVELVHGPGCPVCVTPLEILDARMRVGTAIAVYVWQYPLRLVHWGIVISIVVMSITGYYIHDPYIVGQTRTPFLMGTFRFVHEAFGMLFFALFLLRFYLLFAGDRWVRWRAMLPLQKDSWKEMWEMIRCYLFLRPTPIAKVGHNSLAAMMYLGIYGLVLVEILTGLAMFNWLLHNPVLGVFVSWIPRMMGIQNMRLLHYMLMFVFISFGIFHVHICLFVSRTERRGLVDSIFTGYKVIPVDELEEDDRKAIAASKGRGVAQ